MDSRDPVVVFFEKSVIQSITLLRKWDFICRADISLVGMASDNEQEEGVHGP